MHWPSTKADFAVVSLQGCTSATTFCVERRQLIVGANRQTGKGEEHQRSYSPTAVHNANREEAHLTKLVT